MKTATVRDLRNHFPRVAAWIDQGEPVVITKRGKPFARLLPVPRETAQRFRMPDLMKRLRRTFPGRAYSADDTASGIASSRGDLA